jgi:site-specific recombinase XerC
MAGVDLKTVQELLGHKRISMTLRYSHLAQEHKEKAVNVLDRVLTEKTNYTKTIQFGEQKNVYQL